MSLNAWMEFKRAQYLLLLAIYTQHLCVLREEAELYEPNSWSSWKFGLDELDRICDSNTWLFWEATFSFAFSSGCGAPLNNISDF